MKYTPYTEEQVQSMGLIKPGIYTFEVEQVIVFDQYMNPLRDKNGNDMAKLRLTVWDDEGKETPIYTYMSGDARLAFKLRHFAKAIGKISEYENGTFNIEHTLGKKGKCEVIIKKGTLKQDGSGEMWQDKNDIKDFIHQEQSPINKTTENIEPLEEDLPF